MEEGNTCCEETNCGTRVSKKIQSWSGWDGESHAEIITMNPSESEPEFSETTRSIMMQSTANEKWTDVEVISVTTVNLL